MISFLSPSALICLNINVFYRMVGDSTHTYPIVVKSGGVICKEIVL